MKEINKTMYEKNTAKSYMMRFLCPSEKYKKKWQN